MVTYQDIWVNGLTVKKGIRECASRYEIIHDFCRQFNRPFTVCDIGANMLYFSLRLVWDFPSCKVMAFEYQNFEKRVAHLKRNNATRIMLLKRKVTIDDLKLLATCGCFDVVLALSVTHHFGGEFDEWLDALKGIGRNVILEMAVSDSRSKRVPSEYRIPEESTVLGYTESHIKREIKRPIILVKGRDNPQ